MRVASVAVLAMVWASSAAAQGAAPLLLRCTGQGTQTVSTTTQLTAFGTSGGMASATAAGSRKEMIAESLLIEFAGTAGRIRFPSTLLPPSNIGGKDGWWTLSDVVTTDDNLRGTFRLNLLNKPTVLVDRRTGDIDIRGYNGLAFKGACAPVEQTERKF